MPPRLRVVSVLTHVQTMIVVDDSLGGPEIEEGSQIEEIEGAQNRVSSLSYDNPGE